MICHKSDLDSKSSVVSALKNGKVVIIPTDTVYGFSGIANGNKTDDEIRRIKGRSETKPLIQLIAKPEDIKKYSDEIIPEKLFKLWPGPLTVIVKDKRFDNKNVTTAFRCPGDFWLRSIIEELNFPVYSTSVNLSGFPVLETEKEIVEVFSKNVELIVLDGDKKNALPSTIVAVSDGEIKVLRQGEIKIEED